MLTIYGIKNCDSVKKAIKWLELQQIDYQFVDFKQTPPTTSQLEGWTKEVDWTKLLNKHSKTYRELSSEEKTLENAAQAVALMSQYPLLVKRPVIEFNGITLVGFNEPAYTEQLLK